MTTIVEMSETFQSLSLIISFPDKTDPKYLKLVHSVLEAIRKSCQEFCPHTAVHMRDSGLAVARDPNRIQLDPKFVGCTIAALVCGPIGNGCGCESRFVARVRTSGGYRGGGANPANAPPN